MKRLILSLLLLLPLCLPADASTVRVRDLPVVTNLSNNGALFAVTNSTGL